MHVVEAAKWDGVIVASLTEEQIKEFEKLVKPVIEFLNDFHPHTSIIITSVNAEIIEGVLSFRTEEYLKD